MRVALLSDIHANELALQAVLSDLPAEAIDLLACVGACVGEIVGYGLDPAACVSILQDQADICIAGNHDRVVKTPQRYNGE